jgi:hypothetical protein
MSIPVRAVVALTLVLMILVQSGFGADKPATKATTPKRAKPKAKADIADRPPADALKPEVVDEKAIQAQAEAERAKKAAELVNLDAVAAPLRALFGGVVDEPAMIAVEVQAAVGDVAGENEAMTQQFVQQYHSVLRSELNFIRLICSDLTPEQRPKIRGPAEAALKEAAKQMAKQQNQMQRGIAVRNAQVEPAKLIREAVQKALKETLTEEQMAKYTEEANLRTANRKRAAILSLVSRLDGHLFLTQEQREKITDSLSTKWQDQWEKWSTMMNMYGDRYFPNVPDQSITPFLNPDQKNVWQSLQKIEFGTWWGGGMIQALDEDGWWGAEPENKAANRRRGMAVPAIGF